MTTIASEIERLQTAKADLKTAIENKGVAVESSATLDVYDDYVDDISTGEVEIEDKGVLFVDYDGKVVYNYTVEEVAALSVLPNPPQHEGLTFQGWNWTLEQLKANNTPNVVGALYITSDGATKYYVSLDLYHLNPVLRLIQNKANGVEIDWGDGSEHDISGATTNSVVAFSHTYSLPGDYIISIKSLNNTTITLGTATSDGNSVYAGTFGSDNTNLNDNLAHAGYSGSVTDIRLGENVIIGRNAFGYFRNLKTISITNSNTTMAQRAFNSTNDLQCLVIPGGNSRENFNGVGFIAFWNLKYISFPYVGVYLYNEQSLSNARQLKKLVMYNSNISNQNSLQYTALEHIYMYNCFVGTNVGTYNYKLLTSTYISPNNLGTEFCGLGSIEYFHVEGASHVGDYFAHQAYNLREINMLSYNSVPTIGSVTASGIISPFCKIKIKDTLYETWVTKGNWSKLADFVYPYHNGEPMTKVTLTLAVDSTIESSTSLSKSQILTVATHTVTLPTMADITTTESGGEFYFSDGTTNYELGATITVSEPKTFTLYYNPYYTPSASDLASINDIIGLDPTDPATPDISETEVNAQLDEIIGGSV